MDHVEQFRRVLRLLHEARVPLSLKKCKLFGEKVDYSGHIIQPSRFEMAERTTNAAAKMENPTTQTELRSFLDLYNVFRQFVPNFACRTAPVNKTVRHNQPKACRPLDEKESATVSLLEERLIMLPVSALHRTKWRYPLDTNVYDKPIGYVLLRKQDDGGSRTVGCRSLSLND